MKITYAETNEIFKTLPIGYYLGRKINCVLDEKSNTSYFSPFEDKIVIGYPMIAKACDIMEDTDDVESIVRGLLYHEISHAILTPADMKNRTTKTFPSGLTNNDIINIVEDERIETICRTLYMNTNFRRNIILLNNYKGEEPTNAKEAFYSFIRFHKIMNNEEYWMNRLFTLIRQYRAINATYSNSYRYTSFVDSYVTDLIKLYTDFVKEWEIENKEEEKDSKDSKDSKENTDDTTDDTTDTDDTDDTDDTESVSSNSEEECDENEEENTSTSSKSTTDETNETDTESASNSMENEEDSFSEEDIESLLESTTEFKDLEIDNDVFKSIANNVTNMFYDGELESKLNNIIATKLKKNKNNGSAINAYSGRLNVRSITRDDYRWWTQRNREGHIKQFSKVHFNLFIDNSGSFSSNDERMNTFIRTLDRINNSDFTFDVITINTKIVEWKDHNKEFISTGGNCLTDTIADVIRRHTKPATNNYNIVLFDGDAHSDDGLYRLSSGKIEPFKHFDNLNTIIITDHSNSRYIDRADMTKATVKYCSNYCEEFIDTICNLLEKAI